MGLGSKITVELYDYVPCAGFLINGPFNDAFVEGLGDCVTQGLAQAVGVSNFSADRVRRASDILQARPPFRHAAFDIYLFLTQHDSSCHLHVPGQ